MNTMNMVAKNVPLWTVTTWDKKYNAVEKEWQPNVRKYKYLLSDELDSIRVANGNVRLLYTGKDIAYTTEELAGDALSDGEIVSIPWGGTPSVKYYKGKFVTGDNRIAISNNPDELLTKYLYYYLCGHLSEITSYYRGAGLKHPAMRDVLKMLISYPSAEKQRQIIQQFDILERIIETRQQELQKLDELIKARFVEMFGDIENGDASNYVELGSFAKIGSSKRIHVADYVSDGIPFYRSKEIIELGEGKKPSTELFISNELYLKIKHKFGVPSKGDILMSAVGTIGKTWIVDGKHDFYYKDGNIVLIHSERTNPIYLRFSLSFLIEKFKLTNVNGSSYNALTIEKLNKMLVPLPDVALQKQFADFVKQLDKSKFMYQ